MILLEDWEIAKVWKTGDQWQDNGERVAQAAIRKVLTEIENLTKPIYHADTRNYYALAISMEDWNRLKREAGMEG